MTTETAGPTSALPTRDEVMAQARSENFPVAALALGRRRSGHLLAIYGFARLVDDTGDEVTGDRRALLDEIDRGLADLYSGRDPGHPVLRTLASTVRECGLPETALRRLVEANRLDQDRTRYETFDQLMEYCQLSAAPVGELVLHVFGVATPERVSLSDRVCAGLQVIEHLQDVGEDHARGRVYLPQEDLTRAGCTEADLAAPTAGRALREVVAVLAQRSHSLLDAGHELLRGLPLRPRLAVAGFVAGGRSTLEAIELVGYDVLGHRPRRTRVGFARALLRVVGGR
jgi:squalene synthase HpnC